MGNRPSAPAPAKGPNQICFPVGQLTPAQISAGQSTQQAAPDTRSDIEKKRVELTMSKNDTKNKQDEFDKLVPTEAQQRVIDKATKELNNYVSHTQKLYGVQLKLFDQTLDQIVALTTSPTYEIVKKYKKDIETKQQVKTSEYMLNKEKAFTERRRFLDSDPQQGVSGIGWFSTVDEQILAVFWFSYILFIGTGITLYLMSYGEQQLGSLKNMILTGSIMFFILIYVGHTSIRTFALTY